MKKLEENTFYAIGEKVKYKGIVLEVDVDNVDEELYCVNCYFKCPYTCKDFVCAHSEREDDIGVIFKEVKPKKEIKKPTQPKNATHKIIDRIGRVLFSGTLSECLRSKYYKVYNSIKKMI